MRNWIPLNHNAEDSWNVTGPQAKRVILNFGSIQKTEVVWLFPFLYVSWLEG